MKPVWPILVGIIIVVIVVLGYKFSMKQYKSTLDTALKNSVIITESALNPSELTVSPGTEVNFINSGTSDQTVTSDNKAFDSGNIAPKNVYKHTFKAEGTYSYHSSTHPNLKGKIIVK